MRHLKTEFSKQRLNVKKQYFIYLSVLALLGCTSSSPVTHTGKVVSEEPLLTWNVATEEETKNLIENQVICDLPTDGSYVQFRRMNEDGLLFGITSPTHEYSRNTIIALNVHTGEYIDIVQTDDVADAFYIPAVQFVNNDYIVYREYDMTHIVGRRIGIRTNSTLISAVLQA